MHRTARGSVLAAVMVASILGVTSCDQQQQPDDTSDNLGPVQIGDCLGHVTFQKDLVIGDPRVVDCAGPDAQLQVDSATNGSPAQNCPDTDPYYLPMPGQHQADENTIWCLKTVHWPPTTH